MGILPDLAGLFSERGPEKIVSVAAIALQRRWESGVGHIRHFSPYVICGDPVDDANPMSAPATDGFIISGQMFEDVTCEVSADQGQTWTVVDLKNEAADQTNGGQFRVDLTDYVKGRYGWKVRFSFGGSAGLNSLNFNTTTQVCQAIYPRLTPNGCDVVYHSRPRGVVAVLPNFGVDEDRVSHLRKGHCDQKT